MNKLRFLLLTLSVFTLNVLFAGSAFPDVKFYDSYLHNEYVQQASETGTLDGKLATYLMDESIDIDIKAAVINALSWDKEQNNLSTLRQFLGRKYHTTENELNIDDLTADEAFCVGYMSFMNNNADSDEVAMILKKAKEKSSNSYTVSIILSMAKANLAIEKGDWCTAWATCEKVIFDNSLEMDMESAAVELINTGLEAIKSKCN